MIALYRVHPDAVLPQRATTGAYGYDLATVKLEQIAPRATVVVPTGWQLGQPLPSGVAMLVFPRSSLALKHRLIVANAPGLVDADYGGEIGVVLHNLSEAPVTLPAGTRIAQLVFVDVVTPDIVEWNHPVASTRGGFGSTG